MHSSTNHETTPPLKVLVIDDDDLDRFVIRRSFNALKKPVELIEISDSREAVEAVALNHPDVTLLDLQMPHMDGFAVLEALQKSGAETGFEAPVMMLSSSSLADDKEKACKLGATEYRTKPSTLNDYIRLAEDIHTAYVS